MLDQVEVGDAETQVRGEGEIGLVHPSESPLVRELETDGHILGERIIYRRCGRESIGADVHVVEDDELVVVEIEVLVGYRTAEHQLPPGHEHRSVPESQAAVELPGGARISEPRRKKHQTYYDFVYGSHSKRNWNSSMYIVLPTPPVK